MNNLNKGIMLGAGALAMAWLFLQSTDPIAKKNEVEIDQPYKEHVKDNYQVFSMPSPQNVTLAGDKVPMEIDDVREKLDREILVNTYWHSNSFLLFKRANRWFPVVEPILEANNIPSDFKYLALIESGFANVSSPAGASGYWQFMKSTARSFDLEVNGEVDERYHVEKSTQAACEFLNEAYAHFKDWALVAASYNVGQGNIDRNLKKQRVDNYWDLLLNQETGRYVYRILAVKEILNNADQYGFKLRPADLYEPFEFKTVMVDSTVNDWAQFAQHFGINYKVLKTLNPWLRERFLTNRSKKAYEIKIPTDPSTWVQIEEPASDPKPDAKGNGATGIPEETGG